jgi:hypothetical protein
LQYLNQKESKIVLFVGGKKEATEAIKLVRVFGRLADMIETEASEYVDLSSDLREGVRSHPLVKMFVGTKEKSVRRSKRATK